MKPKAKYSRGEAPKRRISSSYNLLQGILSRRRMM
jgi:hypothetical protein